MKKIFPLLLLLVFAFTACKKSVEGETENWSKNLAKANELMIIYPGFANAIQSQITVAEGLWNDSQGISEEEAKIEKMAAANSTLNSGFVGDLGRVQRKTDEINKKMLSVTNKAVDQFDLESARQASAMAQRVMNEAQNTLSTGADDPMTAQTLVSGVLKRLSQADTQLNTVVKQIKKKKDLARKQKAGQKKNIKGNNGTTTDTKAATSWKCSYCKKSNKAGALECSSCGAPH